MKRAITFAVLALAANASLAFEWTDTWAGVRYGTQFREPGNANDIAKTILQVQHTNGYRLGTNYLSLELLQSDDKDPRAGGSSGAREWIGNYRHTLSFGKLTGRSFAAGPIRDVGLLAGFDLTSKNDAVGSNARRFIVGPTIAFQVPGYLNAGLVLRTERNRNDIVGRDFSYDSTWAVLTNWGIPLAGGALFFRGFANYIGPKGDNVFGVPTKAELLIETALLADVGRYVWRKDTLYAGAGFQYWRNKFGFDASRDPSGGSVARVPQILVEARF